MKPSFHIFRVLFSTLLLLIFSRPASSQTISDTFNILACNHFWKTGVPVTGMVTNWNISGPGPGISAYSETPDGDCTRFKFVPGVSFQSFCPFSFRNTDWNNGVTVADLIKMRKDLLGISPLLPSFIHLAITSSGTVSTYDLVQISKLIVGIIPTLPNTNYSWRAFSSDLLPTNPNDPFSTDYTCMYQYDPAVSSDTIEMIAIKMGDVDGDANPNGPYQVPQNLSFGTVSVPDWTIQAGTTAKVPIFLSADEAVAGFQLGFSLAPALGKLKSIEPNIASGLSGPTDFITGTLNMFSTLPDPALPGGIGNQPLFYINITADQTFSVKDVLKLNSPTMPSLWVDLNDSIHPFDPAITTRILPEPLAGSHVSPPFPNPFREGTSISVSNLDKPATTHLEVIDATGRIIWTLESRLNAGDTMLNIPGDLLPNGSIAFYRLYTEEWMASGKLVRQ